MEVDVSYESVAAFALWGVDAVDADVDDDCALLYHVGGNVLWLADGGDEDVRLARDRWHIGCAGVADRNGGVRARLLLHEDGGDGLADDLAASNHHDVLACRIVPAANEHLLDAGGCCRHEPLPPLREKADVGRMEGVHILEWVDRLDGCVLIEMFWQGKLDENAVYRIVAAQSVHFVE